MNVYYHFIKEGTYSSYSVTYSTQTKVSLNFVVGQTYVQNRKLAQK